MMKLVVVESPAKAKTIGKYLGDAYEVVATMGHVADLPKSRLGVDVEHDFKPEYEVLRGKGAMMKDLKKKLPQKDSDVYLALDPDREGEAIAAHVAEQLNLAHPSRIVFHEITQQAIKHALEEPRAINGHLVDAQKARRVLDRLVGYELSGLLWKKIWYGLSAGRVQSVATRLIVDRERERLAFVPKEFWDVKAHLSKGGDLAVIASLAKKDGKSLIPHSQEDVDRVLSDLKKADWSVRSFETKSKTKYPVPPFTTSTLQQSANSYLGYGAGRTMQLAQQLYQGVNVAGKGHVGLITYMRTDSTVLAAQAVGAMRDWIEKAFGKSYLPVSPIFYKTRSRLAQEAHEAIRPTDVTIDPESVRGSLTDQQFKLYKLIWARAIACQMAPMQYDESVVEIDATCSDKSVYTFVLKGRKITFDGFSRVAGTGLFDEEGLQEIQGLVPGDVLTCSKIATEQRFTKPRSRFTEATLIRALENHGIGRPSTYATIISTIQSRGYVDKEGRFLFPTDIGFVVNDFLVKHFTNIVDYAFTSSVEEDLDDVANGDKPWVPVVRDVYRPFSKTLTEKEKSVNKEDVVILGDSDIPCPECKGKMVKRLGREGVFLSCANFPKCKGMLGLDGKRPEESLDLAVYVKPEACEKCGATMVLKSGRFGKFWACQRYPDCKNAKPLMLTEVCPECGKHLVERKGKWGKTFVGCSGYPTCTYIKGAKHKSSPRSAAAKKVTKK